MRTGDRYAGDWIDCFNYQPSIKGKKALGFEDWVGFLSFARLKYCVAYKFLLSPLLCLQGMEKCKQVWRAAI